MIGIMWNKDANQRRFFLMDDSLAVSGKSFDITDSIKNPTLLLEAVSDFADQAQQITEGDTNDGQ